MLWRAPYYEMYIGMCVGFNAFILDAAILYVFKVYVVSNKMNTKAIVY